MLRLLVLLATAIALSAASNKVANKFIVTFSAVPDPFHKWSFYTMPRTVEEALDDDFALAFERTEDNTFVYCRNGDHRVCPIFDKKDSVVGIQVSVERGELDSVNAPGLDVKKIPEILEQTVLGVPVYSMVTFFVPKETLIDGREMTEETLTAPNGLYLLQTDENGVETNRLHVSNDEYDAEKAGFTKQACFHGMGLHYFQDLKKTGTCDAHRPYFLLFGPHNGKLQGYGYTMYGKASQGRGWFETPPALVAKMIAPNSPKCMADWINKYGLFTMHVFFVEKPWNTWCLF